MADPGRGVRAGAGAGGVQVRRAQRCVRAWVCVCAACAHVCVCAACAHVCAFVVCVRAYRLEPALWPEPMSLTPPARPTPPRQYLAWKMLLEPMLKKDEDKQSLQVRAAGWRAVLWQGGASVRTRACLPGCLFVCVVPGRPAHSPAHAHTCTHAHTHAHTVRSAPPAPQEEEIWREKAAERRRLGIGPPLRPSPENAWRLEQMYDDE